MKFTPPVNPMNKPFLAAAATLLFVGLSLLFAGAEFHGYALAQAEPRFLAASRPIAVGPMAGLPEAADVNGDGHLDVVVACGPCCGMAPSSQSGHVKVLLGDGKGGLRPAGPRVRIGATALRVALGDIDHDGDIDIACVQHSSYECSVLLGDGEGGFAQPVRFALHDGDSPHVHSVVLADVDNDSHLDLIATLVDDHAVAVHLGDGKGGFREAMGQPFFAHMHPYEQLNLVDLNRDGAVDIACTDVRGNGITVLVGSGTGMFVPSGGIRFEAHTPLRGAERPCAMALGDFTGNGHLDAVVALDDVPEVVLMINDGAGEFVQSGAPLAIARQSVVVRVADFDGDGSLDFATGGISLSLGKGGGTFEASVGIEGGGHSPSIAVGDFDEDGRPDLVASSYTDGTITVLLNRLPTREPVGSKNPNEHSGR